MNILIAINDGYYIPAKVMLTSLCENNRFEKHNVYLLYSQLKDYNIEDLKTTMASYGCIVNPVFVDDKNFEGLPVSHHFSIETYYRFLMQSKVPESLDRILWLDADMIIKGSLKEFYYQRFEDNYVVVCESINKDPSILIKKLCLPEGTTYFNAGIILFNLEMIRREINPRVYFEYARDHADRITWLDQDILNVIFAEKKKIDDYRIYNYQHFTNHIIPPSEKKILDNDTVVLHYIGSVKPWHFKYIGYTYKYYRKYARKYESITETLRFELLHFMYTLKRRVIK